MATVPYQPYTTETPKAEIPDVRVQAPGAAFGENVATAISGLGKTIEGAGNDLFARAMALQQLQNETEAREADTQYMMEAGELHAQYSSLQGKDRADAFQPYMKNLQESRNRIRDTMTNPTSKKLFEAQSHGTLGRTIFNGAGQAASAQKEHSFSVIRSQMELDAKSIEDNPKDDGLFQEKIARIKSNSAELAALSPGGYSPEREADISMKAVSKLWSQRIIGLSRTAPNEAARILDQNKTQMTQDDWLRTDNTVRSQSRAVGTINIANEVWEAGRGDTTTPAKSLRDMQAEVRAKAKALDPDDPILERSAISELHGLVNRDKQAVAQEGDENLQIVRDAINRGVRSEQELRADPVTAAAMDALKKKNLDWPRMINGYNSSRDKVTNDETYLRLRGLSLAFNDGDRAKFLETNLYEEQLSRSDMDKLLSMQAKMKEKSFADPRVTRAVGWMRTDLALSAQLKALGLEKHTPGNADEYNKFVGTLAVALDLWQDAKGKPPTVREVQEEIGPDVIRQRSTPGTIFGDYWPNKKSFFDQDVSTPAAKKWITDYKATVLSETGTEPTDEQTYKVYVRAKLMQMERYQGKAGKSDRGR